MNFAPLLAQGAFGWGLTVVAIAGIVFVVFVSMLVWASRYTKVGPNQVLVVSGRRYLVTDADGTQRTLGFRIVKGGGTFVLPVIEKADVLSLELLTVDLQLPEVHTSKGLPVKVDAVAQVKINGDDVSIAKATELFLSKDTNAITSAARQTLEGDLRNVLGTMTVEEIYQNRDAVTRKVHEMAASDLAKMGLGLVGFTIRGLLDAKGLPSQTRNL